MFGFHQLVYQRCSGRESDAMLLPAGSNTQPGQEMGLAGPTVAYKDDGLGGIQISSLRQRLDLNGGHFGRLRKVELFQSLQSRQMRIVNATLDGLALSFLDFSR